MVQLLGRRGMAGLAGRPTQTLFKAKWVMGMAVWTGRAGVRWVPMPARLLRRGMAGQTRGQRALAEATARKNTT
jgi:hypothetical protein